MKTWVFLQGGYFDGTLYGVIDEENLPNEILLHHYENPKAIVHGVTILGITKKEPGDVTVVEKYAKPLGIQVSGDNRQIMRYGYAGLVDPKNVKKRVLSEEHDEYVLEEISNDD